MIIECIKCQKKFMVNSELIPSNGRTIQCGSCGHIWFFNNQKTLRDEKTPDINLSQESLETTDNELKPEVNKIEKIDKIINKKNKALIEYKKTNFTFIKFLNYTIVFVISFGALVLILDTFKVPLTDFFPDLELFLFNLYEVFKDIFLFLKDLIK